MSPLKFNLNSCPSLTQDNINILGLAVFVMLLGNISLALPEVMVDAVNAEKSKIHPEYATDLQSFAYGSLALCGIIGNFLIFILLLCLFMFIVTNTNYHYSHSSHSLHRSDLHVISRHPLFRFSHYRHRVEGSICPHCSYQCTCGVCGLPQMAGGRQDCICI